MLVVTPHSRSIVPLATSGIRVAGVITAPAVPSMIRVLDAHGSPRPPCCRYPWNSRPAGDCYRGRKTAPAFPIADGNDTVARILQRCGFRHCQRRFNAEQTAQAPPERSPARDGVSGSQYVAPGHASSRDPPFFRRSDSQFTQSIPRKSKTLNNRAQASVSNRLLALYIESLDSQPKIFFRQSQKIESRKKPVNFLFDVKRTHEFLNA